MWGELALFESDGDSGGAVVDAEFGEDPDQVGFDGGFADVEGVGGLGVGVPVGDLSEDFAFAWCQGLVGCSSGPISEGRRSGWGEDGMPGGGFSDRLGEVVAGGVLEEVADGAGFDCSQDVAVGVIGSEDDDAHGGQLCGEGGGGRYTVDMWHSQVHEENVGFQQEGTGDGFGAVGGFADKCDVGLHAEHSGEPGTDDGMVVSEHDSDHAGTRA